MAVGRDVWEAFGAAAPDDGGGSYADESGLRRRVALSTAEQADNLARERSPAAQAELSAAIEQAPHTTARAALEDTYRKDFGSAPRPAAQPASDVPEDVWAAFGAAQEKKAPSPTGRRGNWTTLTPPASSLPESGQVDYFLNDLKIGWNSLRKAAEGQRLNEWGELLSAFDRKYTPEQVAADPKLREERALREANYRASLVRSKAIDEENAALQKGGRQSFNALQAANTGEWTMENLGRLGKTLVENPGAAVSIVTQSGPSSAAMLASAVLARVGGFSGGVAAGAGGLASQTVEFGNDYAELREKGQSHEEAYKQALIKSGVVGLLDAVSMKSAGSALDTVLGSGGFFGKVRRVGREIGTQAGLGMAGEAGGSLLSGRTPDPLDVLSEGIGEIAMGPVEAITTFRGRQRRQDEPGAAAAPVSADDLLGRPADTSARRGDTSIMDEESRTRVLSPSVNDPALTERRIADIDEMLQDPANPGASALREERQRLADSLVPRVSGQQTAFTTESGARIEANFALVDASDLVASHRPDMQPNPNYPAELQPRDRTRAASDLQVAKIAGNLAPERLGESGDAGTGAPIIGADGLVESGNARTIAIQRAYAQNGPQVARYREWITANASRFGIDPDAAASMRAPVLVRVRSTPVNRVEFAQQANQASVAQMSPSELARTDAARMGSLDNLTINDDGEFMVPANDGIIRGFFRNLPITEQAALVDANGRVSQAGYARFRNALLAKAYGNNPVVAKLSESMSPLLRNLTNALIRMAPSIAKAKEAMQQGAIADRDITDDIVRAVDELVRMRQEGRSLAQVLAQSAMFPDLTPETIALMEFLDENVRSPAKIGEFIAAYLGELERYGSESQGDMFGGVEVPGRADLIQTARGKVNAETEPQATPVQPAQGEPVVRGGAEAAPEPAHEEAAGTGDQRPAAVPGAAAPSDKRPDQPGGGTTGAAGSEQGAGGVAPAGGQISPTAESKPTKPKKPRTEKKTETTGVSPNSSVPAAPLSAEAQAQADLDAALGDLGDLLGKGGRLNITPEQEQKLVPILTRLFDAGFRLGYHKFKRAAKFVLDTIRAKLGAEVADQITIEHLQGAYIGMSGKYREQGAEPARDVVQVESIAAIEAPDVPATTPEPAPPPTPEPAAAPSPVDEAAHTAATSPQSDAPLPTDGQKDAGNYPKGHVRLSGLDISIENPEGSVRSGVDRDGKRWEIKMRSHYGYIRGTVGKDKDHLDVFIRPGTPTDYEGAVWIIDQNNGDGSFDEHKIMVGWANWEDAREAYLANYTRGWESRIRGYAGWTMERFRTWLKSGDTKAQVSVDTSALKAAGLEIVSTTTKNGNPVWEVGGNTRTHSDMLKRLGGRWYGPKKVWSFYKEDPTAAIVAALREKSAATAPTSAPAPVATPPASPAPAHQQIAEWVKARLHLGQPFTSNDLFGQADAAFGGTQAEGKYTPKDAYDALELGVNQFMQGWERADPTAPTAAGAKADIEALAKLMGRIPSQTKRTQEQDEFQQFSTPPTYAFLANWVANITANDVYLEPSGGIGGLAVFGKNAGAKVIVNEFSARRAEILRAMGFDRVFTENAEQLHNVLPDDVRPTVVVMNPPFSATAGRIPGQRDFMNGARHIDQALRRLEPGGRLVAIMGKGRYDESAAWNDWISGVKESYSLRADVVIDGKEYAKYGTTFDVRIMVFDKDGKAGGSASTVRGEFATPADALDALEGVRNDRPKGAGANLPVQSGTSQQARPGNAQGGGAGAGTGRPTPAATPPVGDRQPGSRPPADSGSASPVGPTQSGAASWQSGGSVPVPDGGRPVGGNVDGQVRADQQPEGSGASPGEAVPQSPTGLSVAASDEAAKADLTESVFESYAPQRLTIAGAKPHPGKLVQSAAMASVQPPAPTYTPNLPKSIIESGALSLAQLEAIVYAGQAHSQMLPSGERMGFFIGDGTGVGKGREIAGIILDNWRQGRRRAVWISEKQGLFRDARRDFSGIGGSADVVFKHSATKYGEKIKGTSGILFTTYATLRQDKQKSAQKKGKQVEISKSRVDQIAEWLGADFDGVIVFDEAHNLGNAVAMKGDRGIKDASDQALAGVELQKRLPQARIVYVSATGATEVSNLSYAGRLGLWGEGTPFATVHEFIGQIQNGGLSGMELVARDMKQLGAYLARSLSFDGVTYSRLEHPLTSLQRDIYNELAKSWQLVLTRVNEALELTGAYSQQQGEAKNGRARAAALSAFWGAHQRFFNQIITSMQMPAVIEQLHKDLAAGEAAVLQLVNTNEAIQNRQLASMGEDETLEELDLTPRENLVQYIKNSFPIIQYEVYVDESGNKKTRPVIDSQGNPVISKDAVAAREALLQTLNEIRVPDGPLEIILNEFGADQVAEVTGRGKRVLRVKDKDGTEKVVVDVRAGKAAETDAEAFLDDRKRILVFSDAGGTGFSFHADLTKKNQRKRKHYLIQPGWRADKAVQGFGRTHRTNQKSEPHYYLVTTDLLAQKRFISSIARRLDQLGALTKGQRDTANQGLFSAKDNLESSYAEDAVLDFFRKMHAGQVPGFDFHETARMLGFDNLVDPQTGALLVNKIPHVPQFLNRLLSLETTEQERVFNEFASLMEAKIDQAIANGTLDAGMQTIRAQAVRLRSEEVVHSDRRTGAETKYVELELEHPTRFVDFDAFAKRAGVRWMQNIASGKVWAVMPGGRHTRKDGAVVERFYMQSTGSARYEETTAVTPDKFKALDEAAARGLWDQENAAKPKTYTEPLHMVVGSLLPVWDRMPGFIRVARTQTDDGRRYLGRVIHPSDLKETLKRLGATSPAAKMTPAEVMSAVMNDGRIAELANGWKLMRRRVSNENRMEINLGRYPSDSLLRELKRAGAFVERIQYAERVFIPVGQVDVLERILASRPVVDMVTPGQNQQGVEQTGAVYEVSEPKGKGRGRGPNPAAEGQRDLFAEPAVSSPAGVQAFSTIEVSPAKVGELAIGFDRLDTPEKAAHAFAALRKSPRERFHAIAVDKNDRPIAAFHLFSGSISQTSVYAREAALAAYDTPRVAGVWLAHNHPSGMAMPSRADELLTAHLKKSLNIGIGVPVKGHIIIAGQKATAFATSGDDWGLFSIPPAARTYRVPIIERVVRKSGEPLGAANSPDAVRDVLTNLERTGKIGGSGLLFLDTQNRIIGWYPMDVAAMRKLKTGDPTTGAGALFRAISRANPAGAIGYIPGAASEVDAQAAMANVSAALEVIDMRLVDGFYRERGALVSMEERGILARSAPLLSRKHSRPAASVLWHGDVEGVAATQYAYTSQEGRMLGTAIVHERDGKPVLMYDIEATTKGRGDGEAILREVLERAGGEEVYLVNLQPVAQNWWRRMGAKFIDNGGGNPDATITLEGYQAAVGAGRGAGAQGGPAASRGGGVKAQGHVARRGQAEGIVATPAPAPAGVSLSAARNVIYQAVGQINNVPSGGVLAVEVADELPEHLRDHLLSQNAADDVEGLYDPRTDAIYLIARNIDSVERAQFVLFHELFGHYGLRGLFGSRLNAQLEMIAVRNPNIRAAAAKKREQFGYGTHLAIEEAMSDLAGEGRPFNGLKQFMAAVQRALRAIGLDAVADVLERMTDAEAMAVLATARAWVDAGDRPHVYSARTMPALNRDAVAPVWYSALLRAVESLTMRSAPAAQWIGTINGLTKAGVKADEIQWSGVLDWLGTQTGKVTREQVAEYLRANGVQVQETMLGKAPILAPGPVNVDALSDATLRYIIESSDRNADVEGLSHSDLVKMIGYMELTETDIRLAVNDPVEAEARRLANENGEQWGALSEEERADYRADVEIEGQADESRGDAAVGAPKFENWQLPGGENYRELLLTLPSDTPTEDRGTAYYKETTRDFRSQHFDQPNILAHVRFNERTDADGQRVLFLEEIQSDWAQKGRKDGFVGDMIPQNTNWQPVDTLDRFQTRETAENWILRNPPPDPGENMEARLTVREAEGGFDVIEEQRSAVAQAPSRGGVPPAPFITKTEAWVALSMKRMIRYAAENGFDAVAWTTGKQQAERYDLSKHVSSVQYRESDGWLVVIDKDGREPINQDVPPEKLADFIGKDAAENLLSQEQTEDGFRILDNPDDLKVGGEGMQAFYDRIVPNVAKDVLRKLGGGQLGKSTITLHKAGERGSGDPRDTVSEQPGFTITPELRQNAMAGQPLFSRRAPAVPAVQPASTPAPSPYGVRVRAKPREGLLNRAVRAPMQALGGARLARSTVDLALRVGGWVGERATPIVTFGAATWEDVKAGVVDKYGLDEAVLDRRAQMYGRQAVQLRGVKNLLDQMATLTRAEAAVLYRAATTADPTEVEEMISGLDENSQSVLRTIKQTVRDLGSEAVRLKLMTDETFRRNEWAYLHRSYLRHELEDSAAGKASRARRIQILGDHYKHRGLIDWADPKKIANIAPDFWGRKVVPGRPDYGLKDQKFVRLERRKSRGDGVMVLDGIEEANQRGRLLEVLYWPAGEAIPARFGSWDQAGTWEARFFGERGRGGAIGMWRDFTADERKQMGEIDDIRYAFAKTMHNAVHNVEVGNYLLWLADTHAVQNEDDVPAGATLVERDESALSGLRRVFRPDEWVRVPETRTSKHGPYKYGALSGKIVPGPIWNDVRQVVNYRWGPEWWNTLLRAWKISKTALSPAVHMNNVMANVVMADWHDVSPVHVLRAFEVLVRSDRPEYRSLIDQFEDHGGTQGMYMLSELQREQMEPILDQLRNDLAGSANGAAVGMGAAMQALLARQYRQAWAALRESKAGAAAKWPVQKLIDLYQAEDTVFRLAAFLKVLEDGGTPAQAGKFARRSFLDYDINAPWIQAMRNSAFPFISFTYRAVPMLIEVIRERPWKLAKLALIMGAINAMGYMLGGGDEDKERKLLPEEKAGKVLGVLGPKLIRMPWNDEHGSPVFLDVRRWMPLGDFFDVGQTHSAIPILPAAVPGGPLALLAELLLNKSQFTGKPITKETDTGGEIAAKVADHLYKAFAPNLPMLPGTYSSTAIFNAGGGRTDAFGREQSVGQALASSVGVKLGSYPADVAARNLAAQHAGKVREIGENISALRREYERKGISREEFEKRLAEQVAKRVQLQRELVEKIGQ